MLVFALILKRRDSGYARLRDQFPDEAQLRLFPLDMCQRVSANKSRMRRDKSGSVCDRQTSTIRGQSGHPFSPTKDKDEPHHKGQKLFLKRNVSVCFDPERERFGLCRTLGSISGRGATWVISTGHVSTCVCKQKQNATT
ncbi:hypothetical protein CDAR_242611 [Caerostris darwini]|uniref:Uncharacterized protein n=1 Tax=Caerostris darwini TaxID=1538125 RepID=A0AAV4MZT6_9ARAC|nr:hypothetical protein CDAR_242611 [Caerostris darwini]